MSIMALQNCTDLLKVEPGASSETFPISHDGKQMINIKVKDVSDTQVLEDPLLIKIPGVEAKHEVSCMSISVLLFDRYP
jgi:hypothetical protein